MGDLVIRAEGVSKQFKIGLHPRGYRTLRETLADAAAVPAQWVRRALGADTLENAGEGTIWALRDVSFDVRQGEVMGIIGRNGAGKSTLLKIFSRITEPTLGRVRIAGRVGSLLEVGTGFHPELTGRENIYLNGAILGMRRKEIARRFDEIVAFSEVERFIDTAVKHYSSGMYLRLAFAVAAHLDPEILLVDEVLAVGDDRFQKKCLGKMESVGREGRTVLFVSHNMPAVNRLCQRVILLDEGQVQADGETREVISKYLNPGRVESGGVEWLSPELAPGDAVARLKRVRVVDDGGTPKTLFTMREPIIIEVEYWVFGAQYPVLPMIQVVNQDGFSVFVSSAYHDPAYSGVTRQPGVYRSRCVIPGDLMTEGLFSVDVWVRVLFPRKVFVHEGDLVTFRVHDTGLGDSSKGNYGGVWGGVIAPRLKWETEFLPGDVGSRAGPADPPVSPR